MLRMSIIITLHFLSMNNAMGKLQGRGIVCLCIYNYVQGNLWEPAIAQGLKPALTGDVMVPRREDLRVV